jgi:hypothetical protein
VRIPRDWFGPKDELVPFGPRAREAADGAAEQDRAAVDSGSAAVVDADLFWGGDASSVQRVLDAPPEAIGAGRRRSLPLIGAALAAVIAIAATAIALVDGKASRPSHSAASVIANRVGTHPAPRGMQRAAPRIVVRRPHTSATEHRSASQTHGSGTQPVSRTYASSATSVSYVPSRAVKSSAVDTSPAASTSRASVASAPPPTHASQPSFGASGALGPMSSPDG